MDAQMSETLERPATGAIHARHINISNATGLPQLITRRLTVNNELITDYFDVAGNSLCSHHTMTTQPTALRAPAFRLRRFLACSSLCLTWLWACAFNLPGVAAAQSSTAGKTAVTAQPRITEQVDDTQLTALPGNTPPAAQAQYDQGAVPDSTPANHILLLLKPSAARQAALINLIEEQQNRASSSFHKWLKPGQFAQQFSPAQSDVDQVTGWLQSEGFSVNKVSKGGSVIDFSGTVGLIRNAFHTEIHTYKVKGITFHANSSNPQFPAALSPVVAGLVSLNDIKPISNMKVLGKASMDPKTHTGKPSWNYGEQCYDEQGNIVPCTFYLPAPGDLAVQYNLASTYTAGTTGSGVTIGVIGDSNIDVAVVQTYRNLFGLNAQNLPSVFINGSDPGQNGDATESYLDVEAAGAMAPGAAIDLYASDSSITTSGIVNAALNAVDDDAADILTVSYGSCEQNLGAAGNEFFNALWQQASAQGQTVFVSSGDAGSAGCDNFDYESQASDGLAVNGFASTPYDTAVGGTDFYYPDYAQGANGTGLQAELAAAWGTSADTVNPATTLTAPITEQPWNDGFGLDISGNPGNTIAAGSGGASSCVTGTDPDPTTGAFGTCTAGYPKPSWQAGTGVPADGVRDLPDVSLFAADGANSSFWPICDSNTVCNGPYPGSPAGSPVYVTGVGGTSASSPAMAGIMALVDQAQKGRQGNINPTLYALAKQFPHTFNDVTVGSNNVPCVDGTPDCSADTDNDGFYSLQKYSAGPGYDQASGLGSINGANLLANWASVSGAGTATQTALTLSQSTFTHGTPITVTAAVTSISGTPTGRVALEANLPLATGQGTITITGGTGTASINSLPGGTYTLTGDYRSSDGSYAASTSAPVSLNVSPEASTATLIGQYEDQNYQTDQLTNGASTQYGDQYSIDVTILGKSGNGTATGTVTLMDGSSALATANVSQSSVATFNFGNLTPGTHTLIASYSGDPSFNASTTSAITVTVAKGAPAVYYNGSSGAYGTPVLAGQPLLVPIQVSPVGEYTAPPTGTVTITLGSMPSQTVPLQTGYAFTALGIANATFTPTQPGTYPITATYSGDSNFAAVPALTYSSTVTVTAPVPKLAATTTALTSSATTAGPSSVTEFDAQVTGSQPNVIPSGYVYFQISEGFAFESPVDSTGKAVLTIGGLPTGTTIVYAAYAGDTNYQSSQSSSITVTSNQGDFSLIATQSAFTIPTGATGTTSLSVVSGYDGLSGAVALSCSTSSPSITCALTPASLTLASDGTPVTTQLVIGTKGATTTADINATQNQKGSGRLLGGAAGTLSLAGLLLILPRRRRLIRSLLAVLLLSAGMVAMGPIACGGGGSKPSPTPTPTPTASAGTYQANVTATCNGIQHSLALRVLVQ
jgi:subtilase family serine protease